MNEKAKKGGTSEFQHN